MGSSGKLKRIAVVGALSSALLIPEMGAVQAHNFLASSGISISATDTGWEGKVTSNRRVCRKRRAVVLIKVFPDGRKKVFSRTSTALDGDWFINRPGATGRFYAKVASAVRGGYGHSHRCRSARSGPVRKR